jgi:ABC-type bacteriocin/lantibiotic exporter with double-glycine peptidase domain
MAAPCVVEPTFQRTATDCGIACLTMILAEPYPTVNEAATRVIKGWPHDDGLSTRAMITIARELKHNLISVEAHKNQDWRDETGILLVRIGRHYHWVAVFEGSVIDPSQALLWNLDTYLHTAKAHPVRFLRP